VGWYWNWDNSTPEICYIPFITFLGAVCHYGRFIFFEIFVKFCVFWYPWSSYCKNKCLDPFIVHDPKFVTNDEAVTGSKNFSCVLYFQFYDTHKPFMVRKFVWSLCTGWAMYSITFPVEISWLNTFFLQFSILFHEIPQISTIRYQNIDPPYCTVQEWIEVSTVLNVTWWFYPGQMVMLVEVRTSYQRGAPWPETKTSVYQPNFNWIFLHWIQFELFP
jgi:hypothetical protein